MDGVKAHDIKKDKNKCVIAEAKQYLVGGVNSPVRAFNYVGGNPVPIERGKGSSMYDPNGNSYIDYILSYGAMILGHAHPEVIEQVKKAVDNGFHFGVTTEAEIKLAKIIVGAVPPIEKIRFTNSGTEAVMGAVRLARGYTGRNKIVKFENSYHGHADQFLSKAGSGLATLGIPSSKGVPEGFVEQTIILERGNMSSLEETFKEHGPDIAAIIVEPVGGNHGVIPPDESFLNRLRTITEEYGALLIFDEVITGFRFAFGTVSQQIGIRPDIICLGKIIGGGLPIGAYGGREDVMKELAPVGEVYQASTFAGNPIVMAAGIATLKTIYSEKDRYAVLADMTRDLCCRIRADAQKHSVELKISDYGTMFSFSFTRKEEFEHFYKTMLKNGVYFAPSEYESNFISFAHTDEDVERTAQLAEKAFEEIESIKRRIK